MDRDSRIRVTVVHQNRIFQQCLAQVLVNQGDYNVFQADHASPDCRRAIAAGNPHVLLIDLNLPDQLALELTRYFHDEASGTHVILLTHGTSQEDLVECFMAGAHGCVPEDSSLQELREAIEKVAAGDIFCSHATVHSVLHRMAHRAGEVRRQDRSEAPSLTPRELEIVRLIAEHLSNKQIARRLSVSLYTVKNHVHNIVEKLQVAGRVRGGGRCPQAYVAGRRQGARSSRRLIGESRGTLPAVNGAGASGPRGIAAAPRLRFARCAARPVLPHPRRREGDLVPTVHFGIACGTTKP